MGFNDKLEKCIREWSSSFNVKKMGFMNVSDKSKMSDLNGRKLDIEELNDGMRVIYEDSLHHHTVEIHSNKEFSNFDYSLIDSERKIDQRESGLYDKNGKLIEHRVISSFYDDVNNITQEITINDKLINNKIVRVLSNGYNGYFVCDYIPGAFGSENGLFFKPDFTYIDENEFNRLYSKYFQDIKMNESLNEKGFQK